MDSPGIPQEVLDKTINRPPVTGWNYLKPGAGPVGINKPPAPASAESGPKQSWSDWWKSNNAPYPSHTMDTPAPELPKALPGDQFYGKKLVWTPNGWQPEEGNPDPQQGQYAGQPPSQPASPSGGNASPASMPPAAQHFIRAAIQAKLSGAPTFSHDGKTYQSPPMDRKAETAPATPPPSLPASASQAPYNPGPDFNIRGGGNA